MMSDARTQSSLVQFDVTERTCPRCTTGRHLGTDPSCDAKHPRQRYVCTREPGHTGPHAACTPTRHPEVQWDDE